MPPAGGGLGTTMGPATTGDDGGAEEPSAEEPRADERRADGQGGGPGSRARILALVVGGLLLAALVLVVTSRDPVVYPPDSPEATVQAFLQSLVDGRADAALLDEGCRGVPLDDVGDQRLRVTIIESSTDGDEATIDLQVTESYGVMDSWTHDETYRLVRGDDGWRIVSFNWPWGGCEVPDPLGG